MSTEPFGRIVDLGAFLKADLEKLTATEVKEAHIRVARQLKGEVIADAPVRPVVTTIVDGRQGATEQSVKPFGVIAYRFAYWAETLKATIEFARSISPVLTGAYRPALCARDRGRAQGKEVSCRRACRRKDGGRDAGQVRQFGADLGPFHRLDRSRFRQGAESPLDHPPRRSRDLPQHRLEAALK
jgi:hypothetical protein